MGTLPRPCPFCGSVDLYLGHLSATSMGIECKCRASMEVKYPPTMPKGQTMKTLEAYLLDKAIQNWNRRTS